MGKMSLRLRIMSQRAKIIRDSRTFRRVVENVAGWTQFVGTAPSYRGCSEPSMAQDNIAMAQDDPKIVPSRPYNGRPQMAEDDKIIFAQDDSTIVHNGPTWPKMIPR